MTKTQLITLLRSTAASQETLHHVMHVWREIEYRQPLPLQELFSAATNAVGVSESEVLSKVRKRPLVRARHLLFYYVHRYYSRLYSIRNVSNFLGYTDHSTGVYAHQTFANMIKAGDKAATLDLRNMDLIMDGLQPVHEEIPSPMPTIRETTIRLFYERRTDRYYKNVKSIRSFYGFGRYKHIDRLRFKVVVLNTSRLPDIDLVES